LPKLSEKNDKIVETLQNFPIFHEKDLKI